MLPQGHAVCVLVKLWYSFKNFQEPVASIYFLSDAPTLPTRPLIEGLEKTYAWIKEQVEKNG